MPDSHSRSPRLVALAAYIAMSARLSRPDASTPCRGRERDADRHADGDDQVGERDGLGDGAQHALAGVGGGFCGEGVRQQDGELVAAEAGEHVAGRERGGCPQGDLLQQHVAHLVAERVVDVLEAVEVADHDRGAGDGRRSGSRRARR